MSQQESSPRRSAALEAWLSRKKKQEPAQEIEVQDPSRPGVLSYGQQRLWLLQQLYPGNSFYHYAHIYRFEGPLSVSDLKEGLQRVIDRHSILRSCFGETPQGPRQRAVKDAELDFHIEDLTDLPVDRQEQRATQIALEEARRPFDLASGPLLRFRLIRLSDISHQLVLVIHHIIGDRWSLELINNEVSSIYRASQVGRDAELPVLKLQYADYARRQREQNVDENKLQYWLQKLAGELPALSLPTDHPRPLQPSFRGEIISRPLSAELSDRIRQLAKEKQTTLFVVLLSAFKALLYRYTGQSDIRVGSPFSNRDSAELEHLVGFFNETLVLRSQLTDQMTFAALLYQIKQQTLEALANKNVPFDLLVQKLQPQRRGGENPLFQVMFLYHTAVPVPSFGSELKVADEMLDHGVAKFDLTLNVQDGKPQLLLSFEYAEDLFRKSTIERMLGHLSVLLTAAVENPDSPLSELSLLTPSERQQLLYEWNFTGKDIPQAEGIHEWIAEQAQLHPERPAIVYEGEQLSYQALEKKADKLARRLLAAGVQTGTPIGLYCRRSTEWFVGMLGILKAGGAYLPLDPDYPDERIAFMLSDARAPIVLGQSGLRSLPIQDEDIVYLPLEAEAAEQEASLELPRPQADRLAYIIYTSGSTGRPKGVPITHRNLLHSTAARFEFYPEDPDVFLLLSSFSFDSSVAGIFWTLCRGGTLVLPRKRIEQDLDELSLLIQRQRVSHTLLLPSLYALLLAHVPAGRLQSLRAVIVAGEACPAFLILRHYQYLPPAVLYNEYGPTEATVWCIAHRIAPDDTAPVPIGKPIANTQAYILDANRQPLPVGVPGVLYIGGAGVASGYLHRPELSGERFIHNPFNSGTGDKLYRTGDLASYREDGLIVFLGRADQQVKIRGHRVEPEEISAQLMELDGVEEAAVIVQRPAEGSTAPLRLIAYISGVDEEQLHAIQQSIRERLPDYMVPAIMMAVDKLPRLPNGKIDRRALPEPENKTLSDNDQHQPPVTPLEKRLAEIWQEVLGIQSVGLTDNFFAIGGDSILSIQIVALIRKAGFTPAPNALFEYQTIGELAQHLEVHRQMSPAPEKQEEIPTGPTSAPLTELQQAFLFNSRQAEDDQGYLQLEFELQGNVEDVLLVQAWKYAALRHAVLRTQLEADSEQAPQQVIQPAVVIPWQTEDWSGLSQAEQEQKLSDYWTEDQKIGIDLFTAPVFRLSLFRLSSERYKLCWSCHHLFLDGWSGGIILQDVLAYYETLQKGRQPQVRAIPSYLAYLEWQEQQPAAEAVSFWQNHFDGFDRPLLFDAAGKKNVQTDFADQTFALDKATSDRLRAYCREHHITLSHLLKSMWCLLLARYCQTDDVTIGITVSGRSADFPKIGEMSGLFMNVVPSRLSVDPELCLREWLVLSQRQQSALQPYEHVPLARIREWIDWPGHVPLFDALFVFGNFLKDGLRVGNISVTDFTGGFSSTYPLTIRVNPLESLEFHIRYQKEKIDLKLLSWLQEQWLALLHKLDQLPVDVELGSVINSIAAYPEPLSLLSLSQHQRNAQRVLGDVSTEDALQYVAPRTSVELQLCRIWEALLDRHPIGITEDFFKLGGNSLLAVQLFSRIEKEMDRRLPATTLLQRPTIEALAGMWDDRSQNRQFSSLVPLKSTGELPPLFCVHSGGAHVFFYTALAGHLHNERPVYALQPLGLDGGAEYHRSIEQMAAYYLEEMKSVWPKGPYLLLGTCFSNAVVLEMAHQLYQQGEAVERLFIIDSGPLHLFGEAATGKSATLQRFWDLLRHGEWQRIGKKIAGRLSPAKTVDDLSVAETDTGLRDVIDALNQAYKQYDWQPYPGRIHFIRSSEFDGRKDKRYHIRQWEKLAAGGLEVSVVPGHHLTLFEEPEVQGLANQIEAFLRGVT